MRSLWSVLFLVSLSNGVAAEGGDALERVTDAVMAEVNAAVVEDMKTFCADAWMQDFVMQERCIEDQKQGYVDAQAYDVMSSVDATVIWANCSIDWSDERDRTDWKMMAYCIGEQEAARKRLQSQ